MKSTCVVLPALVISLSSTMVSQGADEKSSGKISLFDGKTLTGWYVFLKRGEKNKDPEGVFSIEDGCIHVSGKTFGYISTEKEYSNFKLTFSYKWGEKKWPPRMDVARDAGLLYHVSGDDMVWSHGQELQIQEGDTGDLWLVPGKTTCPMVQIKETTYGGDANHVRVPKWETHEKPHGEWNTLVLIAKGKHFEHWVNGHCVMAGEGKDHEKGKLQLQSEGAEVWYRDITLEGLD
jgi:hypothetical protein